MISKFGFTTYLDFVVSRLICLLNPQHFREDFNWLRTLFIEILL